jgi:hypothetical protein
MTPSESPSSIKHPKVNKINHPGSSAFKVPQLKPNPALNMTMYNQTKAMYGTKAQSKHSSFSNPQKLNTPSASGHSANTSARLSITPAPEDQNVR